ncbi:MAG TPA: aminoacyl-tRNA hydrolase [Thermoanaerobaculia bacterium]|nr:aminoacyl-tRNA hydrolase [Thermoanaerobaculia bacterium]
MKLIVGLGNPGPEYAGTRHNAGFLVADAFARKFRIALSGHEKDAFTGQGRVAGQQVLIAKPQNFMNLSGSAVAGLTRAYGVQPSDLIVIYDDIDLPVGRLRIRQNGSAGTHNGMKSIVACLGSEAFPRLRFGVRGAAYDAQAASLRDYVLENFDPVEAAVVSEAIERSVEALLLFVRDDLRRAMNQFNRDPVSETQSTS